MSQGGLISSNYLLQQEILYTRNTLFGTNGCTIKLFKNNYTAQVGDTAASYTESTFTGYASWDAHAAWPVPTLAANGHYSMTAGPNTFSCTGGTAENVYGFYAVDSSNNLLFSQNFSAALIMSSGSSFQLTVEFDEWALAIVP